MYYLRVFCYDTTLKSKRHNPAQMGQRDDPADLSVRCVTRSSRARQKAASCSSRSKFRSSRSSSLCAGVDMRHCVFIFCLT